MRYFAANLLCHFGLLLIIILFVVIFISRNQKKKTKHVITYFIPVILSAVALYYIFSFIIPRAKDIVNVYENNYYTYTGKVNSVAHYKNYVVVDGNAYFANPMHISVKEGDTVRVRYTANSNYAVEISEVNEVITLDNEEAAANSSPFVDKEV